MRARLPEGGRLYVDRELPFLCLYRSNRERPDPSTSKLVTGEAAYLIVPEDLPGLSELISAVAAILSEKFGAFLLVEIESKSASEAEVDPYDFESSPVLRVYRPRSSRLNSTVEFLVRHLKKIKIMGQPVGVQVSRYGARSALRDDLLNSEELNQLNAFCLRIAVPPIYRDEVNDPTQEFPLVLKSLRRKLGLALRRSFYEFARALTTSRPPHFHELGRRAVVKSVWEVDRRISEVADQFDYLLSITPVNSSEAWTEFERSGFEETPDFYYLPIPFDPPLLKRQLYQIPLERIEDPALARLFLEKQLEIDRRISALSERNSPNFLRSNLQIFGSVDDQLLERAHRLLRLERVTPKETSREVDAERFAEAARAELGAYRALSPDFESGVQVTEEVAGVMVSRGRLLVNADISLSPGRVDSLLQHEVGVHIVTYHNGRRQPFRLLQQGLADYEPLQEGLAVFAEFLVGGLTLGRVRQLAARVVAARLIEEGATFVDTFRVLTRDHGFGPKSAYNITMRVYRGGGVTKDAVYLRGFDEVIQFVRGGGDLDLLWTGKLAMKYVRVIKELRLREVLVPPALRPNFLSRPEAQQRLASVRTDEITTHDLIEESLTW